MFTKKPIILKKMFVDEYIEQKIQILFNKHKYLIKIEQTIEDKYIFVVFDVTNDKPKRIVHSTQEYELFSGKIQTDAFKLVQEIERLSYDM